MQDSVSANPRQLFCTLLRQLFNCYGFFWDFQNFFIYLAIYLWPIFQHFLRSNVSKTSFLGGWNGYLSTKFQLSLEIVKILNTLAAKLLLSLCTKINAISIFVIIKVLKKVPHALLRCFSQEIQNPLFITRGRFKKCLTWTLNVFASDFGVCYSCSYCSSMVAPNKFDF